jgi:hypothetical protein
VAGASLEERVKYGILISTLCIILAALAATPASAENPFYLLGKIGDTSTDDDLGERFSKVIDGDDNSWSLGLGLRLGRFLVFQAEYHELGEAPGRGSPCPDSEENCIEILVPLAAESTALSVTFLRRPPLRCRPAVQFPRSRRSLRGIREARGSLRHRGGRSDLRFLRAGQVSGTPRGRS